jgi:hypothetical protein
MAGQRIDAFEGVTAHQFGEFLVISGHGHNPTSGWKNWFRAIDAASGVYEFVRKIPGPDAIPIALPFHAIGVFPSPAVTQIILRHQGADGRGVAMTVAVLDGDPLRDEAARDHAAMLGA